ncbi:hypothetical protein PVAND_010533 [Polypedilum vanderplanki]|uniref:Uncharacterized protein n=1 Tax=Polypedilum vanderplanki TaxID=319348 RepID=A0A9J6CH11_POLVA|nr:hypothetical protein PVAND_010533 [Polypedilum vanderplanki]
MLDGTSRKRKPPKRRIPVETQERPLPPSPKRIVIHSIEILPNWRVEPEPEEDADTLEVGDKGLNGRSYDELMEEWFGEDAPPEDVDKFNRQQ